MGTAALNRATKNPNTRTARCGSLARVKSLGLAKPLTTDQVGLAESRGIVDQCDGHGLNLVDCKLLWILWSIPLRSRQCAKGRPLERMHPLNVLIVYGTTEGQTRKIAQWTARHPRECGHELELRDSGPGDYYSLRDRASRATRLNRQPSSPSACRRCLAETSQIGPWVLRSNTGKPLSSQGTPKEFVEALKGEEECRLTYLWLVIMDFLFMLYGLYTWGVYPFKK